MGGQLRGFKRSMYEGGLRQAAIARWPGMVPAGRVSDEPWAFWDFLPTAAELAGAKLPHGFQPDGLSLVSFLKGGPAPQRDYFYWELHEGNRRSRRCVSAIGKPSRTAPAQPIELYDLKTDMGEPATWPATSPNWSRRAASLMQSARVDDPNWPLRDRPAGQEKSAAPQR